MAVALVATRNRRGKNIGEPCSGCVPVYLKTGEETIDLVFIDTSYHSFLFNTTDVSLIFILPNNSFHRTLATVLSSTL